MISQIRYRHSTDTFAHDDGVGESEMRAACPKFFQVKHGKRETFTAYRGFLIVRHTVQYSQGRPDLLYVSSAANVRQAQRLADLVLNNSSLVLEEAHAESR